MSTQLENNNVVGDLLTVTPANPAVSTFYTYVTTQYTRILTVETTLATDANVATRSPGVEIIDVASGRFYGQWFAFNVPVAASQIAVTTWGIGNTQANIAASGGITGGRAELPNVWFPSNTRIQLDWSNKQAGDQLSNIIMLLELR